MRANHYKTGYSGLTGADVAGYLKRTFTVDENKQATSLIAMFEAQLCSLCSRQFDYNETYEETFFLPASKIFTHNFPVATITEIKIDGEVKSLTEDTDYYIWETYLEFTPTLYGKKLSLKYTIDQFWGDEINHLLLQLISHAWLSAENGASVSEIGFAAVRQVFSLDKFEKDTQRIINLHRKRLI